MSLELYEDLLNLAREQVNVDLLVKLWHDSISLNKKNMVEINERIISFLPYLRERVGMSPSSSKDFKKFVEEYDEYQYNKQCPGENYQCLKFFAKRGDLRNVKKAVEKGANNLGNALQNAARYGHMNVINFLIQKVPTSSLRRGLEGAVRSGNLELITFFLEKGAKHNARVFFYAAVNGSPEILKLYQPKTIAEKNAAFRGAARGGHFELMKEFIDEKTYLNEGLTEAAKGGHLKLVKYLIEEGAKHLFRPFEAAVRKGNLQLIKYFLSLDSGLASSLIFAIIEEENLKVIDYLIEGEFVTLEELIEVAATESKFDTLEYLVSKLLKVDPETEQIRSILVYCIMLAVSVEDIDKLDYLFSILPPERIIEEETVLDGALLAAILLEKTKMLKYLLKFEGRTISLERLLEGALYPPVILFLTGLVNEEKLTKAIVERNFKEVKKLIGKRGVDLEAALKLAQKLNKKGSHKKIIQLFEEKVQPESEEEWSEEYSD